MEIPDINMLSEFEAGMKCIQNPSFISRFSPFPSFWKWGALIFAIFATFSNVIKRIKFILIRFHAAKPSSNQTADVFDFSDDDVSSASSDDEQEGEEEEDRPTTSFGGQHRVDEDFCVRGSITCLKRQWQNCQLRQRRRQGSGGAWSEFASGKNVVKLWDSLKLSLDIDEDLFNYDPKSVVSTWDLHHEENPKSHGGFWGVPAAVPTVFLTSERNGKGDGLIFGGYDSRMSNSVPAFYAEWSSPAEKVARVSTSGVGKVYVRDNVSGVVTVGDVRNVRTPLETVGECDGETWWDADAVIVENEFNSSN